MWLRCGLLQQGMRGALATNWLQLPVIRPDVDTIRATSEYDSLTFLFVQVTCSQHIRCLQNLLTSLPQRQLTRTSRPALIQLLRSRAGGIEELMQAASGPLQQLLSNNKQMQAPQISKPAAQQLVDTGLVEALASFLGELPCARSQMHCMLLHLCITLPAAGDTCFRAACICSLAASGHAAAVCRCLTIINGVLLRRPHHQ